MSNSGGTLHTALTDVQLPMLENALGRTFEKVLKGPTEDDSIVRRVRLTTGVANVGRGVGTAEVVSIGQTST